MEANHIFIIDDDKFFAKYFIMRFRLLVKDHVEFHHFTGMRAVFTSDSSIVPSLILLDNELNGELGIDYLPELAEMYPKTEIILISSSRAEDLPKNTANNSAPRFISKDDIMMDKIAARINQELAGSKQSKVFSKLFKG